eukprot:TRINITY_DN42693_c0_g1_i1.p1 TRINITY_DN42693_c0_g1~~TRINITY_DN42693_c0_g1_i1.p1  ORF type:complete len:337 (-),score=65.10 TRINITY_DN42693_c0_g1_i1:119-1129(-)
MHGYTIDDDDELPPGWGQDDDDDEQAGCLSGGLLITATGAIKDMVPPCASEPDRQEEPRPAKQSTSSSGGYRRSAFGDAGGDGLEANRRTPRDIPLLFTNAEKVVGPAAKPPRPPKTKRILWTVSENGAHQPIFSRKGGRENQGLAQLEKQVENDEQGVTFQARCELEEVKARKRFGAASAEDTLRELEAIEKRVRSLGPQFSRSRTDELDERPSRLRGRACSMGPPTVSCRLSSSGRASPEDSEEPLLHEPPRLPKDAYRRRLRKTSTREPCAGESRLPDLIQRCGPSTAGASKGNRRSLSAPPQAISGQQPGVVSLPPLSAVSGSQLTARKAER